MAANNKQRQIKEIVKCGKDPSHFFNKYVKIQHPTRGTIPFKTYRFQDDCVKDFNEHRFNVIVKSRQLGLSTLTAAYAVVVFSILIQGLTIQKLIETHHK